MSEKTSARYVGLDVHKREVTACILDAGGQKSKMTSFPLTRTRLEAFARVMLRPTDHVVLEATTNSWAVADVLRPHELHGVPVCPIPCVVGVLKTRTNNERMVVRRAFKQRSKALTNVLSAVDRDGDSNLGPWRLVGHRGDHEQEGQARDGRRLR